MKRLLLVLVVMLLAQPTFAITTKDETAVFYDRIYYDADDYGLNCAQGAGSLPGTVPAPYNEIFVAAGSKHNVSPALVAAIFYAGEHGSSWPDPPPPYGTGGPWASSSAAAQGPFQFLSATWAAYGDDGDNDGDKDIQDLTDAAFGAAQYLAANGGTIGSPDGVPGDQPGEPSIRNAIWHYNHADWYVEQVFEAYLQFLSGGAPGTGPSCGGGLGVAADGFVFPLRTTQSVITAGVNGATWCYQAQSSCHGSRGADFYNAADIHAPTGTVVVAARGGTIHNVGSSPLSYVIKGDDGLWYFYTHMLDGSAPPGLTEGTQVQAGQELGAVGDSADAEGSAPHIHFHVGPTLESLSVTRECVSSGTCTANANQLIDPQPVLVESFNDLGQ